MGGSEHAPHTTCTTFFYQCNYCVIILYYIYIILYMMGCNGRNSHISRSLSPYWNWGGGGGGRNVSFLYTFLYMTFTNIYLALSYTQTRVSLVVKKEFIQRMTPF